MVTFLVDMPQWAVAAMYEDTGLVIDIDPPTGYLLPNAWDL